MPHGLYSLQTNPSDSDHELSHTSPARTLQTLQWLKAPGQDRAIDLLGGICSFLSGLASCGSEEGSVALGFAA